MRKSLLGFMMFVMFTPVLACIMTFCPMQSAQAAEQMPCHQSGEAKNDSLMLALDCMGVDLFQQDTSHDLQPDISVDSADYVWADLIMDTGFDLSELNNIRGPPDKLNQPKNTSASIILTTQRFRI